MQPGEQESALPQGPSSVFRTMDDMMDADSAFRDYENPQCLPAELNIEQQPAQLICSGIRSDGKPCQSKTHVTNNVNKTGKMAIFQNMQRPLCQTCVLYFKRCVVHCLLIEFAIFINGASLPHFGNMFSRCYVCLIFIHLQPH